MTEAKHDSNKVEVNLNGKKVANLNDAQANFIQGFIAGATAAGHPQTTEDKKEEESK